jgi:anti-repressor protein
MLTKRDKKRKGEMRMNELIKITYDNDRPAVSARDLHEFLGVGADYRHWFPRMCEYGFTEGQDFNSVKNDRVQMEGDRMVSRTVDDAILTIDMAKELCMLQRNEKGKQARQYFIQLEKDWNSPEKVMARALQIANKKLQVLEAKAEEDKPKVLFADSVAASNTSILVGELAKLLRQNGVDIGGTRLFRWMRENGYLIRRSGSDYNMPTQRSMEMGLFTIKETAITHADGTVTVSKTVKVTPKAQIYFVNKFLGEKNCETRGANHGR